MLKKILILFKIARKLALSDALKIFSKIHRPPTIIKIFFNIFSISFSNKTFEDKNLKDEEKLCNSIEKMGTTFIKLGQFLATRPDIIGEELSKQLEKLQDRLPPFSTNQAKEILKKNLGESSYKSIVNLSEPVAAASVAQVHKAQINDDGIIKDVAIKILRPEIRKVYRNAPTWAAVFFALHPLNTQSVTYISSRSSVLATLFFLSALALLIRAIHEWFPKAGGNHPAQRKKRQSKFYKNSW